MHVCVYDVLCSWNLAQISLSLHLPAQLSTLRKSCAHVPGECVHVHRGTVQYWHTHTCCAQRMTLGYQASTGIHNILAAIRVVASVNQLACGESM